MRSEGPFRNIFVGIVFTITSLTTLFAEGPADLLMNQFAAVDSGLAVFSRTVRPSKGDSAALARGLDDLLHQNAAFFAVALADVHGSIVAFSGYTARDEALSQKVSRLEWYTTPKKTHRPYYGPLTEAGRRFFCVWSRPVLVANALGLTTCEGVVVAYVNIAECFKTFSSVYPRPFEIARPGDTMVFFHTDSWQTGLPHVEEPLTLMGGVAFTFRYDTTTVADTAAAGPIGEKTDSATAASAMSGAVTAPLNPANAAGRPSDSRVLFALCALGLAGLAAGSIFLFRRKRMSAGNRKASGEHEKIVSEERDAVRKSVKADMYREIRSRIGTSEIERIEKEIKAGIRGEIERTMLVTEGALLRDELQAELREKVRAELCEEIRRQLLTAENAALRDEARAKVLDEVAQRLKKEIGGQLEMEALQELTRQLHAEVRAEHAKPLKERALRELDERIHQEVSIRERAMVLANARASLREAVEKELREQECGVLRQEARAALFADIRKELEQETSRAAPGIVPEGDTAPTDVYSALAEVRASLRKIDESDALQSLATTVDLLTSSQRQSPYFNLNAAQTASMIEYLGNVSGRLKEYVAGVRKEIGRLHRSVEQLLRNPGLDKKEAAIVPENGLSENSAAPIAEPETLVESQSGAHSPDLGPGSASEYTL